jgi:hypothetical protein
MKSLTGLFLGAGASYEAGMPLAWDLSTEIKDWLTADKLRELNAGWRLQGTGHCDAVIEDLISALERPHLHYEAYSAGWKFNAVANGRSHKNIMGSILGL